MRKSKKDDDWFSESVVAARPGCDKALISRRVARGDFGKTIRAGGRIYISGRVLSIKAKRVLYHWADELAAEKLQREKK